MNSKKRNSAIRNLDIEIEREHRLAFEEGSFVLGTRHQNRGNNVFYNAQEDFYEENNSINNSGNDLVKRKKCLQLIDSEGMVMSFKNDIMCMTKNKDNDANYNAVNRSVLQRLADVSTSLVTTHGFKTETSWDKYVSTFYTMVQNGIDAYFNQKKISPKAFLLYKGGNVIVKYLEQALQFGSTAHQNVDMPREMRKLLSRSDADFEIVFDNIEAFEEHHVHIKIIVVQCLHEFRIWLSKNQNVFHLDDMQKSVEENIFQYNDIIAKNNAKNNVKNNTNVNKSKANLNIDLQMHKRNDFFILKKGGYLGNIILNKNFVQEIDDGCDTMIVPNILKGNRISPFYITWNDTLSFYRRNYKTSFELIRMKLNFQLKGISNCSYNVPGELIDVSIKNPEDAHFQKNINKKKDSWTRIINIDDKPVLIPNLDYLVNIDLKKVLLDDFDFPWMDEKYIKRLNRLILGCIILSSQNGQLGNTSNSFMYRFRKNKKTFLAMTTLISILETEAKKDKKYSIETNEQIENRNDRNSLFYHFRTLIEIIIVSKERIQDKKYINEESAWLDDKYYEILKVCIQTLDIIHDYYITLSNSQINTFNASWYGKHGS